MKTCPSGISSPGVLAPPLVDHVGDVGDLHAEDERQARRPRSAFWFASDTMPASATTVTSGRSWAAMNDSMTGSIVLVSALLPFERGDHEREPVLAGEQADGDLRLQPPLLGEARLAEPVAGVGLEIQRGHVVKDQAGRAQAGVRGAGRGQPLPPRLLRIGRQAPLDRRIRRRRDPGFLQDPQAVQLADRLDDPGQHQMAEHLIPRPPRPSGPAPCGARKYDSGG